MSGRARAARLGLVLAVLMAGGCGPASERAPLDGAQVREWLGAVYAFPISERLSPPVASRLHGYAGVTLYEALRRADPDHPTLAGKLRGLGPLPEPGPGEHDWSVAAAEAERRVLFGLVEPWALASTLVMIDTLAERQIERRAAAGIPPEVLDRSRAYGGALAAAVLERAAADGFERTRGRPYQGPTGPGVWVNTTSMEEYAPISVSDATQIVRRDNPSAALVPGAANARNLVLDRPKPRSARVREVNPTLALEPWWGELTPWGMAAPADCAPPPPAPYAEAPGSAFRREAEAVYDATVSLTDEQRTVALFWADNPGITATPPGHWVSILYQLVPALDLEPLRAAEAFALLGAAMADAFVSSWHEKYRSHVVRPVTYIRHLIDPSWETLVVTPPFPEYTSGHSVVSGAAAEVLGHLLGDSVAFTDATHLRLGLASRTYGSFDEAAEEAAMSRLFGGIHYPMAIDHGLEQGRCVARALLGRVAGAGEEPLDRPTGSRDGS